MEDTAIKYSDVECNLEVKNQKKCYRNKVIFEDIDLEEEIDFVYGDIDTSDLANYVEYSSCENSMEASKTKHEPPAEGPRIGILRKIFC